MSWGANSNYILLSKQMALHNEANIVSNNLSNHSAVGQKEFETIYDEYKAKEDESNMQDLSFVHDATTHRHTTQGGLRLTDHKLDVALKGGNAYFTVQNEQGTFYTRAGNFTRDADGFLTTSTGDQILSEDGGPIVIPEDADHFLILEDGSLIVNNEVVNQLSIVAFENENLLEPVGHSLFKTDQAPQPPAEDVRIKQGYLEDSNYSLIDQMTKITEIQRDTEALHNIVKQNYEHMSNLFKTYSKL